MGAAVTTFHTTRMTHAIAELQAALETAQHNSPIHRSAGEEEQADLCDARASELEDAIFVLRVASRLREVIGEI